MAICAEMEGSFHQGLVLHAGADDVVAFRKVVVTKFVPEHSLIVVHGGVVQVVDVRIVPLEVTLEQIAVHCVTGWREHELVKLLDETLVDTVLEELPVVKSEDVPVRDAVGSIGDGEGDGQPGTSHVSFGGLSLGSCSCQSRSKLQHNCVYHAW
jgi:hypothetical protein